MKAHKNGIAASPSTAGRKLSWCEFSPYNSPEEGGAATLKLHQRRPASKPKPRPATHSNRSSSPPFPLAATQPTDVSKKSERPASASFKKALSLLVQPNKQETAEFLAQFNSLRLYHRLLEPEIRPVSVVTTGRLREKAMWGHHHRRNSFHEFDSQLDYTQVLEENEELRSKVRELTIELQAAKQTITSLQQQCGEAVKVKLRAEQGLEEGEKPRRLSLPGNLNRDVQVPKLIIPKNEGKGFHEEFMENLPYFSQSWRDAIPDAK